MPPEIEYNVEDVVVVLNGVVIEPYTVDAPIVVITPPQDTTEDE